MEAELEKKLNAIGDKVDAKLAEVEELVKNSTAEKGEQVKTELKSEVKALVDEYNKEYQKHLDALDVRMKEQQTKADAEKPLSFEKALGDALAKDEFKAKLANQERFAVEMPSKAIMVPQTNFVNEVVPADYVPGVKYDPTRANRVRQYLPVGNTSSDVVRFVRETGYTDGTAVILPGATKPQSDATLTAVDAPVRKIATHMKIAEEMLEDFDGMVAYVSNRLPNKLLNTEDTQLLYGTGVSPQLEGITVAATDFAAGAFEDQFGTAANEYDVLIVAMNQLNLAEYFASAIMLNPTDYHKMVLLKATTNEYLYRQLLMGMQPSINGVPIVLTTAITAGDFLVGDFRQGSQMFQRKALEVRFFEQDGDNVVENLVTVRAEERLALANYVPNAYSFGTFAAAKTLLNA